jgi:hypothetical protein
VDARGEAERDAASPRSAGSDAAAPRSAGSDRRTEAEGEGEGEPLGRKAHRRAPYPTPSLPGAPDPTAGPRPRERGEGESPGRGAHRRIDGGDGEEE